jgi:hypothetical protein
MNYIDWFWSRWPSRARRHEAMQGYRTLAISHQETLADIALRNYVLSPAPEGIDAITLARIEGRRAAALEILAIASMDINELWEIIERKQAQQAREPRSHAA